MRNRIIVAIASATLLAGPIAAPVAHAAVRADKVVPNTPAQLKEFGYPRKPNTVGWGGTAKVHPHKAAVDEAVVITGTAPKSAKPGQELTMYRYLPRNTKGDGTLQALDIHATVNPDRTFTMIAYLGRVGTWGYSVGFETTGASPEMVAFTFQLTTTP